MTSPIDFETLLIPRVEDVDGEKVLTRKTFEEVGLDDEVTIADVKRVENRLQSYRAGAYRALAHVSLEDLVADPKKDRVTARVEYGTQSEMRSTFKKSHTVGKGDKSKTFYGHSTVVVSNGHEPELLEAIETIAIKGRDLFGPK